VNSLDEKLLQANKETEIFSAQITADEIEKSLNTNAEEIQQIAQILQEDAPEALLFVGSGASYCSLYAGQYFLKTCSKLDARLLFGPELVSDNPPALRQKRAVAILASYSGKTADTVEASQHLKSLGLPRLAITRDQEGPIAQDADHVIAYHSKCLFTSAMANLLMLLAELLELRDEQQPAREMKEALAKLPEQLRSILPASEQKARAAFEAVKDEEFFYVLGDGATWAHAYQFGYTNLMEYARLHAACLRTSEWRHGPLEILFRNPTVIMLMGNDGSRKYAEATRDYCQRRGAKTIVFDVRDYFETHPVLAPFVLHPVTQFFLMYLCTYHGINMDDYLEMHVHSYTGGETYF